MKSLIILAVFFSASCASNLLPANQRQSEEIVSTGMSKKEAYNSALVSIAKNFGNSEEVIKLKDKEAGTIVLKGNIPCNIFRQTGDINQYSLEFTLSIMLKDQKAKLFYEDMKMVSDTGSEISWAYNQLSSQEKVQKSKACLKPITKGLFRKNDNW